MHESVLDQQVAMARLDNCPHLGLGEIDEFAVEHHLRRSEEMLLSPPRSDRLGEVIQRVVSHRLGERLERGEVRAEVGEYLAEGSLRILSAVDRPEAPLGVVEAMVPRAEEQRREGKWIRAMPDSPKLSPAHPSKLTSCLAAALTSANWVGSVARRSTSMGASSSRRVFVPNSHARAVLSSKLSTIMRTIL